MTVKTAKSTFITVSNNMHISPKLLPTIMIVLNILTAIVYAVNKDVRHTIYWASSAVLISAITY